MSDATDRFDAIQQDVGKTKIREDLPYFIAVALCEIGKVMAEQNEMLRARYAKIDEAEKVHTDRAKACDVIDLERMEAWRADRAEKLKAANTPFPWEFGGLEEIKSRLDKLEGGSDGE